MKLATAIINKSLRLSWAILIALTHLNSTDPCKSIEKDITKSFRQARSKSRNMHKVVRYLKMCEREPSRIPVKKAVNLMSKNKHRRQALKRYIRRFIPKSSC